jgi:hypothetical protein
MALRFFTIPVQADDGGAQELTDKRKFGTGFGV